MISKDASRLARLAQQCTGEAARVIECCLLMPPERGYRRARDLLAQRFGDNVIIVDMWVRRLAGENRTIPLQEYADNVRSCYEALISMDALAHLDNSTNLPKLVERLPGYLQSRWRGLALKLRKESPPRRPALADLLEFMHDAALEANDPLYGIKPRKPAQPHVVRGTSLTIADSPLVTAEYTDTDPEMDTDSVKDITKDNNALPACAVCNGRHAATKCRTLRRLALNDRMVKVRSLNLCFCCLKPGHVSSRCLEQDASATTLPFCTVLRGPLAPTVLIPRAPAGHITG